VLGERNCQEAKVLVLPADFALHFWRGVEPGLSGSVLNNFKATF